MSQIAFTLNKKEQGVGNRHWPFKLLAQNALALSCSLRVSECAWDWESFVVLTKGKCSTYSEIEVEQSNNRSLTNSLITKPAGMTIL